MNPKTAATAFTYCVGRIRKFLIDSVCRIGNRGATFRIQNEPDTREVVQGRFETQRGTSQRLQVPNDLRRGVSPFVVRERRRSSSSDAGLLSRSSSSAWQKSTEGMASFIHEIGCLAKPFNLAFEVCSYR